MHNKIKEYFNVRKSDSQKYYLENLLDWSLNKLKTKLRESRREGQVGTYKILYQTVGNSPVPLVLSILALEPEKVIFLVTDESRTWLDVIIEHTKLRPSQYETRYINFSSMVDIYEVIKREVSDNDAPNAAIDITGGTKVMSSGAALAGAYLNIDVLYLESVIEPSRDRPTPGRENLIRIDNPFTVFGDRKLNRARDLFSRFDFIGAVEILGPARVQVREPQIFHLYYHLALAYAAWDDFNFDTAYKELRNAIKTLEQYHIHLEWRPHLKEQLRILSLLENMENTPDFELYQNPEKAWALIGSCYANARRRGKQRRYDFAVLLLYRVLEMLSQMRLASWKLDSRHPSYSELAISRDELTTRFKEIQRNLYRKNYREQELPQEISLMQGLALLKALEDPWADSLDLERVKDNIDQRNSSILAHGTKVVTKRGHDGMLKLVQQALEEAWKIWPAAEMEWNAYRSQFRFVVGETRIEA